MTRPLRTCVLAALCLIILTPPAFGIYTPNPAGRWKAGRFSLLADFQYHSKDIDPAPDVDVYGFFVRPSFAPIRNMSIYGRFGVQGADKVDPGFAGGFGVQYAYEFPRAPEWAVGGAFDFLYWAGDNEEDNDRNIEWAEFQFTPAVSYAVRQVPGLVPYAGVMFDFVEGRGSIEQDDPVGLLFGTSYDPTPQVRLELQFRVISENGIFLSAGYTF